MEKATEKKQMEQRGVSVQGKHSAIDVVKSSEPKCGRRNIVRMGRTRVMRVVRVQLQAAHSACRNGVGTPVRCSRDVPDRALALDRHIWIQNLKWAGHRDAANEVIALWEHEWGVPYDEEGIKRYRAAWEAQNPDYWTLQWRRAWKGWKGFRRWMKPH